jgi:hypothetical protein
MTVISIIGIMIICALGTGFMYGIWKVESERDDFKKKWGVDPYRQVREEKNDNDQDK